VSTEGKPAQVYDYLPKHLWWVFIGLTVAWGGNWSAMKVVLAEVPPWTFRTICLGAGAGVLFGFLRASGQTLAIPRSQWPRLALIALFSVSLWNLFVAYGVKLLPTSGRAIILAYTMPAMAIPLSVWFLKEKLTARKLVGLALGLAGMALLVGEEALRADGALLGAGLTLCAALVWAIGTVLQKKFPIKAPLPALTAWLMLVGGVPVYIGTALMELDQPFRISGAAWLGLSYNVFVAYAFGYWAWIKLVDSVSVTVFALCMLLTPAVGVLCGMLILGERPSLAEYAALALVIGSISTVARK
jgi:drug/metabolite transporter (DMT)-like permease